MATKFVDAYDTRTGKKLQHRVPEYFIGHRKFGRHLSKTPRQKAQEPKPQTGTDAAKVTEPATQESPTGANTTKEK
ncbi:hypothetical protein [Ruania rhizosphaerae]|uniref:hypothetical protein n=1 Tax=Ruania rhizosphaerae TaxID=1840413 RepID=UPI0013584FF9|nr:hypothetical protein [Ruania rhizosphaerae]